MIQIMSIPSECIEAVWPKVVDHVAMFCEYSSGEFTPQLIYIRVQDRTAQMLVIVEDQEIKATVVTNILDYPNGDKVLHVVGCGGRGWEEWGEDLVKTLKEWGSSIGADRVQLRGRPGWSKKLRKLGWEVSNITMEVAVCQ